MKKKRVIASVVILALLIAAVYSILRWYGRNSLLAQDDNPWSWWVNWWVGERTFEHNGVTYVIRDDVINILCIGIDKEGGMDGPDYSGNSRGQADAIFVVSLDMTEKKIRVVSIPRDTFVTLEVYDLWGEPQGTMDGQIALQFAYGDGQLQSCDLMAARVYDVLGGVPIHSYVALDLDCIIPINDAVGGVELTMDQDYTMLDPVFVEGATIRLMGEQAVHFVRTRDTEIPGSAYTRSIRQKQYVTALVEQAKQAVRKDITLPMTLFEELKSDILTDLDAAKITFLATEVVNYSFSEGDMYVITGEIQNNTGWEEFYPDEEAIWQLKIDLFYEEADRQ